MNESVSVVLSNGLLGIDHIRELKSIYGILVTSKENLLSQNDLIKSFELWLESTGIPVDESQVYSLFVDMLGKNAFVDFSAFVSFIEKMLFMVVSVKTKGTFINKLECFSN